MKHNDIYGVSHNMSRTVDGVLNRPLGSWSKIVRQRQERDLRCVSEKKHVDTNQQLSWLYNERISILSDYFKHYN